MNEEQNIRALFGPHRQGAGSLLPAVCLCRHGETDLNAGGRLRGLSDPDLDAAGQRQAQALGLTLQATRPLAILASPLRRTVQTAEAIAAACGLTVELCDDLLDRDYGPHNGQLADEVTTTWGSVDNAPGVEPRGSVLARAQSALDEAGARATNGPVVLVSHDAVNSAPVGVPRSQPVAGAQRRPSTARMSEPSQARGHHLDRGRRRPQALAPIRSFVSVTGRPRRSDIGGAGAGSYSGALADDSPTRNVAGRWGVMAGIGCRRGPDHSAGGASTAWAMAYPAAS